MIFGRRHYLWLADFLQQSLASEPLSTDRLVLETLIESLARALKSDNPNFDERRFLAAIHSAETHNVP